MNVGNATLLLGSAYAMLFLLFGSGQRSRTPGAEAISPGKGRWAGIFARLFGGILVVAAATVALFPHLPVQLFDLEEINGWQASSVVIAAVLSVVIASNQSAQPIAGHDCHPVRVCLIYAVVRTAYLVVYEWFFRGLILFASIDSMGIAAAIVLNVSLYAAIHVFRRKEFFGSIPFGVVLCLFTIWTESIWPAVLLHWFLAAAYEAPFLKPLILKRSNSGV
ncbi:MAG TPA: CPBP family intramembrane glutamic endopeptidase [Chitinophagaceae bacterium]|nr:CPBP family intramembrane glutamic endopeptidase [Chitinophagaceae bacterium]